MSDTIDRVERPEINDILDILGEDPDLFASVIAHWMIENEFKSVDLTIDSEVRETGVKYRTDIKIKKEII